MYAAQQGAPSVVRALLQRGAQVNVCSEEVSAAHLLLLAAAGGHEEVAPCCLRPGRIPRCKQILDLRRSYTPGSRACYRSPRPRCKRPIRRTRPGS